MEASQDPTMMEKYHYRAILSELLSLTSQKSRAGLVREKLQQIRPILWSQSPLRQ
jgi:hypothetical protein